MTRGNCVIGSTIGKRGEGTSLAPQKQHLFCLDAQYNVGASRKIESMDPHHIVMFLRIHLQRPCSRAQLSMAPCQTPELLGASSPWRSPRHHPPLV